ncbi:hypothetical protein CC80DRAFT_594523 [Byssothecium circinans]|uniref:Rhodopsin domain-containing protein n=1 Tax=Byssothecium circinans TaxID=147558 RepID=A0A6A5TTP2_9PLEO|nr:hypothetical protein CC80DRAFT_594523 [Byssothecium circinans]
MADSQRLAVINNDDHGALLAMNAWVFGCVLVLCTAVRIGARLSTRHLPKAEDVCIFICAALAVTGIVTISLAVDSGLGKRDVLIDPARKNNLQKHVYISNILYVLTLGFSKLSVATFLTRLACTPKHKTAVLLLGILVVCWMIAITGVVAFSCKLPRPWNDDGKCISILPFWFAASIFDILTDLLLILLPVHIVSTLQLQTRKKIFVIAIFALRILLVALSILRLVYFRFRSSQTTDRFFDTVPRFIFTQAHAALAVVIACSPALKPFLENLGAGMSSDSLAKRGAGTTFGQGSVRVETLSRAFEGIEKNNKRIGGFAESGRGEKGEWAPMTDEGGYIVATFKPTRSPSSSSSIYSSASTRTKTPIKASSPLCPPKPPQPPRTHSPPRPPPPPEELRPDLSMFGPKRVLGDTRTAVGSQGQGMRANRSRKASDESLRRPIGRGGGGGRGSARGGIQQANPWDARFNKAHAAWV